ncbi:hypothetical protein WDW37_02310 [Bdellovibrionota bacterium FG-1]
MKKFHLFRWISISSLFLTLTGCAALGLKDNSDDPRADPVAAAAARFRNPASDSRPAATESTTQSGDLFGDDETGDEARAQTTYAEHLVLGMPMNQVMALWGQPSQVESAGDSREGNQRWTYFSGLSSRWGLGGRRVVFFEGGHVAGWQTPH